MKHFGYKKPNNSLHKMAVGGQVVICDAISGHLKKWLVLDRLKIDDMFFMLFSYIEEFANPPLRVRQFKETAQGKWQEGNDEADEICSNTPESKEE